MPKPLHETPPFRLEHMMQPSGSDLGIYALLDRVDKVIAEGGSVAFIDFAHSLVPEHWAKHLHNEDQFIVYQPQHFNEAAPIIRTFCQSGVGLVVLVQPRTFCLPGSGDVSPSDWEQSRQEWAALLEVLESTEGTTMVALNSVRDLSNMVEGNPEFAPWSEMAADHVFLHRN